MISFNLKFCASLRSIDSVTSA